MIKYPWYNVFCIKDFFVLGRVVNMENNISAVQQTIRAITWSKQKRPILPQILAIIFCSSITIIDIISGYRFLSFSIGNVTFTFAHFLPMLLFGIMGYLDGMIFLIVQFFAYGIFAFDESYLSFITMLMCAAIYFISRGRWILSWKKFWISVILMSVMYGNLWVPIAFDLMYGKIMIPTMREEVCYFFAALPESALALMIVREVFVKLDDKYKSKVYMGQFYTKFYEEDVMPSGLDRSSKLGKQVTIGLLIDLLVIIIATIVLNSVMWGNYATELTALEDKGNPTQVIISMILMLLSVVVPVVIISYYVLQKMTIQPISRLTEYIKGYSETIDTTREEYTDSLEAVKPVTKDEIWELYSSTGRLVTDTTNYIKRLRKEQQLEEDLEMEKAANEAKSQFLSNMSHEIRTPINAVLGFDEMIIRETQERGTLKYATDIKTASENLLQIINDILDLSRIESGRLEIEDRKFDFSEMLNGLISMADVQASNKGLQLMTHINPDMPSFLRGDEMRIRQCALNILSNAVKYTEEGSVTLNVDYETIDSHTIEVTIEVTDTGIGIKKEDLDRIFTPYERLEDGLERHIQGTGLGLDIVRRILDKMGSKLEVRSIYGEGSTFFFSLRVPVEGWEPLGDVFKRYEETKLEMNRYHESFQAPKAHILVIDDTNMNLMVIRGLLKRTRIQIDTADSGREALQMICRESYDMIFIDHKMPGMDGIETLHAMNELEDNQNQDTIKVALTANAISGAREEYIGAGFDDYLSKPIDMDKLEKMLIHYLPKEYIILEGDEDYVEFAEEGANYQDPSGSDEDEVDLSEFDDLQGIDIKAALKNCDQIEILRAALHEFYVTIEKKSEDIERFFDERDYRNYTIAVHALKGNARLIGAGKLSSDAAYLEQCGNEENEAAIVEETPKLLEFYRSYLEKLAPIGKRDNIDEENLQDISESEFKGALRDMRELIGVFDYDNALSIMRMLEQYKIPEQYKDHWGRIRQLMGAVDLDGLMEELKEE
ncbi:Signal transduction histidine kinase [Lachnospiraceae bacterium A10]|nr:Signal transduction histidine kinase [Lachnospiraceae bacterium A10]